MTTHFSPPQVIPVLAAAAVAVALALAAPRGSELLDGVFFSSDSGSTTFERSRRFDATPARSGRGAHPC